MKKVVTYALLLGVMAIMLLAYHFMIADKQKVGYVKTGVLLQKYHGMADANKQFERELEVVSSNLDTLKVRYERLKSAESVTPISKKSDWAYKLGVAENEFLKYSETAQQQMQERQSYLSNEVIKKMNTFIEDYGKKHNYKLILGTTNDGSILYGLDQDDLTEEVLSEMNAAYKSSKASAALK